MGGESNNSQEFDCVVLSGGGAKGAYGAGAAKAILAYRQLKKIARPICYVGTSAGALNASVLATHHNADALIKFWRKINSTAVLGVKFKSVKLRVGVEWLTGTKGKPFAFYPNKALKKLIQESVKIENLKDSHLVVAATDYSTGEMKAFYASALADSFLKQDATLAKNRQRLGHWRKIKTQEVLENALLASAAIPIFFPPVWIEVEHNRKVEKGWHVDGGVGNHTPTREAAYFLRYLRRLNLGGVGDVYCVNQDPPRIIQDGKGKFGLFDILERTLEIYHYIHNSAVVGTWDRINYEIGEHGKRVAEFVDWLAKQSIDPRTMEAVLSQLKAGLGNHGGKPEMFKSDLIEIEPGGPLGDSLDFDPKAIEENIKRGYTEALQVFKNRDMLNKAEFRELSGQPALGIR